MSNDEIGMHYQSICGISLGIITLLWNLYFLVKLFFDKNATGDMFYDATLQTFGMPIAVFLFAPFLLIIALMTSPIWALCLIRSWYIKRKIA